MEPQEAFHMSSRQLNELWKFENKLCQDLLHMPLRTCTAQPSQWGKPMVVGDFERLKDVVRRMWIRAALDFEAFVENSDIGWGLRVCMHREKNLSLSPNSLYALGWFAEVPSPNQCPTGHRYLRSLYKAGSIYLGGPVSLSNWSSKPSIDCFQRPSLSDPRLIHLCWLKTKKSLPPSTPIVWNYGSRSAEMPELLPVKDWMQGHCCTEVEKDVVKGVVKKSKIVGSRIPKQRELVIPAYRFCVYCGCNLSEGKIQNTKPHFALHHCKHITIDAGFVIDDEENGVDCETYLHHIDIVCRVVNTLKFHGYNVHAACLIFTALVREDLMNGSPSDAEKEAFFEQFKKEAGRQFHFYKIVFLRGLFVPTCFEELLPLEKTNYKHVCWK